MIKNLIEIYPNESFYSYLSRLFARSGYIWNLGFSREVFKNPNEYINYNFVNVLNDSFKIEIENYISLKEIILNHTLFKYYSRFLPLDKRMKAFEVAIENDKNLSPLFLPIPYNKFDYYLRYCPCCVKEDREHFGEAFFHVEHQIVELHCCPIHGVKLIDTKIVNSKAHDATFVPLEMVVESLEEIEANEIEKKLSNYIFESLKIDLDLTNEYQIGSFLVDRLNDSYLSPRGEQKDLNKIMKDMMAFYVNYKYININKKRVATIYRNEYLNVFNIFLIAFFEKIPVKDLCEFKQTKMTRWEAFDEIVKKYYKDGKNYNQIAFLMGVNKEVIRQVIIGTYDKPKKTNSRYKCQRWNWEAIDNECCLKFEKVVLEALEKDKSLVLGRKLVASLFGLKDHTLRNLPKLKKMIKKYKKSE